VYDEKIKTERENIDAARKALTQMDAQVNERLSRSTDDRGAERAVQIRRQQQAERTRLQNDISRSQSAITKLNEERAPIAAEVRKVEAEVGPIKYIANFIYGDNPDANILEKAVTWVIIIIVSVFDPLAVILLLASQYSFQWFRRAKEEQEFDYMEQHFQEVADDLNEVFKEELATATTVSNAAEDIDNVEPIHCYKCETPLVDAPGIGLFCPNKECDVVDNTSGADPIEFTYIPSKQETVLDVPEVDPNQLELNFNQPLPVTEEQIVIEHIALDPIDEEIIEDSDADDTVDIIEAKRLWKEANPEDSLKHQRRLFEAGVIKQLPWEVEPFLKKKTLTYLEKVGKTQIKKEISGD
jgi:hypothetical protein